MAKTLKGFGGGTVIEVRESFEGNGLPCSLHGSLRRRGLCWSMILSENRYPLFGIMLYVLHAFQKKSKKGGATPRAEIDLVGKRLKDLIDEKERQR